MQFGVEHGDAAAVRGEGVGIRARHAGDHALHAKSPQVIAHVGAGVVGAEQSGNMGA